MKINAKARLLAAQSMTGAQLLQYIGKPRFNSLVRHPFYTEYYYHNPKPTHFEFKHVNNSIDEITVTDGTDYKTCFYQVGDTTYQAIRYRRQQGNQHGEYWDIVRQQHHGWYH